MYGVGGILCVCMGWEREECTMFVYMILGGGGGERLKFKGESPFPGFCMKP